MVAVVSISTLTAMVSFPNIISMDPQYRAGIQQVGWPAYSAEMLYSHSFATT